MNEMVDGWGIKTLKDLCVIHYGKSPDNILSTDGIYPVIGTGNDIRHGNGYLYNGESVIMPRKGTIAQVTYMTGKFWVIDTAYYLSCVNNVIIKYLFRVLENTNLNRLNEATGVPSLSRELIYKLKIEYPILINEQSKIAEILETVDKAIEQTQALIIKQERIKIGLMQDLLNKGIDKNGNIRSEKTHKFKDSPLGKIPVEWEVTDLSSFIKKLEAGISVNSIGFPCGVGQYGVLKTSALSNGKFLLSQNKAVIESDEKRLKTSVRANTILLSRMNTPTLVGDSCYVENDYPYLFLPDRIWQLILFDDKIQFTRWLSYILISPEVRNYITLNASGTSGTMKNISKKNLLEIIIKSPTS